MNWGAAKGAICAMACLAIQGCASVEQTAGDDAGAILSDQGGGIPQLPVFQPASIIVDEPVASPLRIELQRRNGRAVVTRVF